MREHGRNVSAVSRAIGHSRRQVHRYLEEHGLNGEERQSS